MLKIGAVLVLGLLVVTALGSDVSVKRPDRTVKIERRGDHARAASPTPTPTPTPAPDSGGKDWSVLSAAKRVGLVIVIVALILFVGIPALGYGICWAGNWWDEALNARDERRDPKRQQRLRDRQQEATLTRDAEIARLRNEIAQLRRDQVVSTRSRTGTAGPSPRSSAESAEAPPHSINGAGPPVA